MPAIREIEPGISGIWATCAMGKEGLAVNEVRDLFDEVNTCNLRYKTFSDCNKYIEKLYSTNGSYHKHPSDSQEPSTPVEEDIEAQIRGELSDLQYARTESFFAPVKLDTQCRKRSKQPTSSCNLADATVSHFLQDSRARGACVIRPLDLQRCSERRPA